MSQNHGKRQSDDEEEDLELLRLAVLQSLPNKKESNDSYDQSPPNVATSNSFNIPQISTVTTYSKNNISRPNDNITAPYYTSSHNLPQTRPVIMPLDNFNNRQRVEKLDINEPYVPQRVPPVNADGSSWIPDQTSVGSGYTPYIPHKVNDVIPLGVNNVQLSPRSLAFVAENNDILMRRKGENLSPYRAQSPMYYPVSPTYNRNSPSPYRKTSPLCSWSPVSPPKMKSKSRSPLHRNRLHQYSHRRSMSRSPPPSRQRSPIFRRMSKSRSPLPTQILRHNSPQNIHRHHSPLHSRRVKSRSPMLHIIKHKISPRRHVSRSPPPARNGRPLSRSPQPFNDRRRSPLSNRHQNKIRHSPSPHIKRSPGHMQHEPNDTLLRHPPRLRSPHPMNLVHRRSASPRPRSHSRSPTRKYGRRSRERGPVQSQSIRRRSPYNNGRRRYDGQNNGFRNRGRKRSASPPKDRHRRTRSKSPERNRRDDNKRNRRNDRDHRTKIEDNIRNDRQETKSRNCNDKPKYNNESRSTTTTTTTRDNLKEIELKTSPQIRQSACSLSPLQPTTLADEKLKDNTEINNFEEEKKLPVTHSENENDESSNDDDDGIDLFPSDESESENEGRFKSSTSKNERDSQAPTLSFMKLGESFAPTAVVKDLKDFESSNRNSPRRSSDRDRSSRSSYNRRRGDDRFRKSDRSVNNRNDRRKVGGNSSSRRDRDEQNKVDSKKDDKPMFKSTFQAVENEVKNSGRVSSERDTTDRKSSSSKRRNNTKETKDVNCEQISSTITTVSSSSTNNGSGGGGGGNGSGKKPIHLRLGAMTNTFKTPKKSTAWSPSEKV